jgi:hypothetical protein
MTAFIVINEEFDCQNCGHHNQKLPGSCRNHCVMCLHSLHVDQDGPGDRLSECGSLMPPVSVEQDKKKGWMIWHQCKKCEKRIRNKVAEDDDFKKVITLSKRPHDPEHPS